MDWKLVLEFVKVLAWPVVTVALGLTFRRHIAGLSQRVDSVETPVGSLTFATQANAIAHEAESVEDSLTTEIEESTNLNDADDEPVDSRQAVARMQRFRARVRQIEGKFAELHALAEEDPVGAVLGAWRELEANASRATLTRVSRQSGVMRIIEEHAFLPHHLIRLSRDLMLLRDRVASAGDVSLTASDAKAYVAAAQTVSDALQLAQTPQAAYLRYERAVQGALLSLNLPVHKQELDGGVDFLVGKYDGVVGIEVKYTKHSRFPRATVEMIAAKHKPSSSVPVLVVANAPLTGNGSEMRFDPEVTSVREVIQWRGEEDNDQLMQALSRYGVSY
ncbi:hypothetical protein [Streptomyces fungicidicus]|uniref:hypothetical protein n=1 Tax=Streptomyces fungicidicus TaxID=68203 RepID=UPI0038271867